MVKIPVELFLEIAYFLNDWLRLMGFGAEYRRLSRLVWKMYKADCFKCLILDKYYYINGVVKEFKRLERIEKIEDDNNAR